MTSCGPVPVSVPSALAAEADSGIASSWKMRGSELEDVCKLFYSPITHRLWPNVDLTDPLVRPYVRTHSQRSTTNAWRPDAADGTGGSIIQRRAQVDVANVQPSGMVRTGMGQVRTWRRSSHTHGVAVLLHVPGTSVAHRSVDFQVSVLAVVRSWRTLTTRNTSATRSTRRRHLCRRWGCDLTEENRIKIH